MMCDVYAVYIVFGTMIREWHEKQTNPVYVRFRDMSHTEYWGALTRYIVHHKWDQFFDVQLLPSQVGESDSLCPMFCFVETKRPIVPDQPFNWDMLQETTTDRKYKNILLGLGIMVQPWSVFCRVRRLEEFHNFNDRRHKEVQQHLQTIFDKPSQKKREALDQTSKPSRSLST